MSVTTSLYQRLLSLMVLAMIILGALLLLQASHGAHQGANRAYDRLLDAASRVLVEQVSWQSDQLWFDVPASALEMLAPNGNERVFYTLVDAEGTPISGNVDLPPLAERYRSAPPWRQGYSLSGCHRAVAWHDPETGRAPRTAGRLAAP